MVVRSAPSSGAAQVTAGALSGPVRTCVGCRRRTAAAELLRVVAAPAGGSADVEAVLVVPDPRRRAAGRGAWVHPFQQCVDLAERRRAFSRALRVGSAADATPVRDYVRNVTAFDR